jgi:hypothetical protein
MNTLATSTSSVTPAQPEIQPGCWDHPFPKEITDEPC